MNHDIMLARLRAELAASREENRLLRYECDALKRELEKHGAGAMQIRAVARDKARYTDREQSFPEVPDAESKPGHDDNTDP